MTRFLTGLGLGVVFCLVGAQFWQMYSAANPFEIATGAWTNYRLMATLCDDAFLLCIAWGVYEGVRCVVRTVRQRASEPPHPRG